MGEFQEYAGKDTAVQRVARNIVIGGGGRLENIPNLQAADFIHDADEVINSALSSAYMTPIVQITRDGDTFYPHPIPNIARRLAAAYMVQSVYSEIDQNVSANAERYGTQAITELETLVHGILRGDKTLEGQRLQARNNFANPRVVPREPSSTPRTSL